MPDRTPSSIWRPGPASLLAIAGLLGMAGVAVSAAASHRRGGDLAVTAGLFLLLHAAVLTGIAAAGQVAPGRSAIVLAAGYLLAAGTVLFSGDLAMASLAGLRPFPPAAPIGGALLLLGWLVLAGGGIWAMWRR